MRIHVKSENGRGASIVDADTGEKLERVSNIQLSCSAKTDVWEAEITVAYPHLNVIAKVTKERFIDSNGNEWVKVQK